MRMRSRAILVCGLGLLGLALWIISGTLDQASNDRRDRGSDGAPSSRTTAREATSPPRQPDSRASETGGPADAHGVDSSRDPADDAFREEWGEVTPSLVKDAFVQTLASSFPDYRLSSDEIDRAAGALYRLRETRLALNALPMSRETSEERRALLRTLEEAVTDFSDVMDMDPAEFSKSADRASGSSGIDSDDDPGYIPDNDFLDSRR